MTVTAILLIVFIYLMMGVVFVIPFLWKGISKVDEGTRHGTIGFKIIIIPGVIVFWPVLLNKWIIADKKIKMSPAEE